MVKRSAYAGKVMMVLAAMLLALPAHAKTDLQLPRYASLKSDDVNVRTGPGLRYQIKWVINRTGMPVEVIAEFEQWRKIRDIEGGEGWVHTAMLSNQRATIVTGNEIQTIYRKPAPDAEPVARMETGAQAELLECDRAFCKVHAGDVKGWVDRSHLWGVYPEEWVQ